VNVLEHAAGDCFNPNQQDQANHDVAGTTASDVQHRQQDGGEQQPRTQVLLEPEQQQRSTDHDQDRSQVGERRQVDAAHTSPGHGEQLAVLRQVGCEKHDQQNLDRLRWLDTDRTNHEPECSTATVRIFPQPDREHLQHNGQAGPGIAVPAQPSDAGQQAYQRHHAESDHDPHSLTWAEGCLETRGHHLTQAGERGRDRQQKGISRRQFPAYPDHRPKQAGRKKPGA